jgi:hypothetical protein
VAACGGRENGLYYGRSHTSFRRTGERAAAVRASEARPRRERRGWRWRQERLPHWRSDAALIAAARGSGPLLTAGDLFLVQARTRRAVLLDGGALDTLPYALEAGPAVDRILREVYGVDLFNPPAEARGGGRIWETYSRDRWRRIGRDHGVLQVLTPADWALDLPQSAESPDYRLYHIPD